MSERREPRVLGRGSDACETLSWVAFAISVWFAAFALVQAAQWPSVVADVPETASEMQLASVPTPALQVDGAAMGLQCQFGVTAARRIFREYVT